MTDIGSYYNSVPKDIADNLAFRREIIDKASKDKNFAASVMEMCMEDIYFYINTLCWTYDPRDTKIPNKPFITYGFQDEYINSLLDAIIRGYDVVCDKSRAMGASWIILTVFEHFWKFSKKLSFLLVSRNAEYVDAPGNPKSLFWKLDFLHKHQPRWALPTGRWRGHKDPNRAHMRLFNPDTESVFNGESTTGDIGRGDRRTAVMADEFAAVELNDGFRALRALRDTSNCRIYNSTPQGSANAFHEVRFNTGAKVCSLHWSSHPIYSKGLYTSVKVEGKHVVKVLDENCDEEVTTMRKSWRELKEFKFPEQYPFLLDGKLRSPWYDWQESRCASPKEIAQELDIDYEGSAYQFFDTTFINMLISEYCLDPVMTGDLLYCSETFKPEGFMTDEKHGKLSLWFNISGSDSLLFDKTFIQGKKFGIGADVSMGTGRSNSVATITDLDSGKKIGVWRNSNTDPIKFAHECMALGKYFNNAKLIWDASGATGASFTQTVLEKAYPNLYFRKNVESARMQRADKPGYYLQSADKEVILRSYRLALEKRQFINPSEQGMLETLQFISNPSGNGGIEHSAALNTTDPTGARHAHGDEVIADALACRLVIVRDDERGELEKEKNKTPYMSMAYLFEMENKASLDSREDW